MPASAAYLGLRAASHNSTAKVQRHVFPITISFGVTALGVPLTLNIDAPLNNTVDGRPALFMRSVHSLESQMRSVTISLRFVTYNGRCNPRCHKFIVLWAMQDC